MPLLLVLTMVLENKVEKIIEIFNLAQFTNRLAGW